MSGRPITVNVKLDLDNVRRALRAAGLDLDKGTKFFLAWKEFAVRQEELLDRVDAFKAEVGLTDAIKRVHDARRMLEELEELEPRGPGGDRG